MDMLKREPQEIIVGYRYAEFKNVEEEARYLVSIVREIEEYYIEKLQATYRRLRSASEEE